jgi:hypothetical protein
MADTESKVPVPSWIAVPHGASARRVGDDVVVAGIGYYDDEITLTADILRRLGFVPAPPPPRYVMRLFSKLQPGEPSYTFDDPVVCQATVDALNAGLAEAGPLTKHTPDEARAYHRRGMSYGKPHVAIIDTLDDWHRPQGQQGNTVANLTFGDALEALKTGRSISREGWNGKNMYLYLKTFDSFDPVIVMVTAKGTHQPGWLASQADMLTNDWRLNP